MIKHSSPKRRNRAVVTPTAVKIVPPRHPPAETAAAAAAKETKKNNNKKSASLSKPPKFKSGTQNPVLIAEPFAFTNSFVGTEEYLSPEVLSGAGHSAPVDWWELGIFIYELVYGTTPFKANRREQTFENIMNKQLAFPERPEVSQSLKDIVTKLLERDPARRLGAFGGGKPSNVTTFSAT